MAEPHGHTANRLADFADDVQSRRSSQSIKADTTTPPTSSSPVNGKSRASTASKKRALSSTRKAEPDVKKTKRRESEEGEASSLASSPPSLRSASMSESASDDGPDGKNQPLRFPVDGKFTSEVEKAEVMALPEVRREEILAERATVIEREQQNRMLIQLLRNKGRKDVKDSKDTKESRETKEVKEVKDADAVDKKKRKAPATDLEDSQRKSTRQKTTLGGRKVGETSAPLEEYKRQREQRGAQIEQKKKEDAIKGKVQKKVQEHIDADAEGESEDDWGEAKHPKRATTTTPPKVPATKPATPPQRAPAPIIREEGSADLQDFNRARFGRAGFGRYCFYPGFEEAITGSLVRIAMGVNEATGQNRYFIWQIKRFTEGKPYALENATGARFVATRYLIAGRGKDQMEFPFIFCSDSRITQAELDDFKERCTNDSVPVPNKSFLIKKTGEINRLVTHKLTNDELNERLRREDDKQRKLAPKLRAEARLERDRAIARGDEATVAKCDAELAVINGAKLAFGTKLYEEPPKPKLTIEDEARLARIRKRQEAEQIERENRMAQEQYSRRFVRKKKRVPVEVPANVPKPMNGDGEEFDDLFDELPEESEAVTPPSREAKPPISSEKAAAAEAAIMKAVRTGKDQELVVELEDPDTSGLDSDLELPM
ncbi:MAG: hypothetical protein M1816_001746 [Peltula sp. TS41687]|nr:MAG: hypothetical protein M1816_001746 [Peltula sp. TS41687]